MVVHVTGRSYRAEISSIGILHDEIYDARPHNAPSKKHEELGLVVNEVLGSSTSGYLVRPRMEAGCPGS